MAIGPLIAIVGQTASGKTALALDLAERYNGEIICADSRTIYRGMDIGTAKPAKSEQCRVPHHLLDVVDPDESFTVADFQRLAKEVVVDISQRGKIPFLVGGSGLYTDSVLFNYRFSGAKNDVLKRKLEGMSLDGIVSYAHENDIFLGGIDRKNRRHLIRAIERGGVEATDIKIRESTLVLGFKHPNDVLGARIRSRIDTMIEDGFVEEAVRLGKRFGWENEPHTIYGVVKEFVDGTVSMQELKSDLARRHMSLAKRQHTWFKRNKSIHWIKSPQEAIEITTKFLNNQS